MKIYPIRQEEKAIVAQSFRVVIENGTEFILKTDKEGQLELNCSDGSMSINLQVSNQFSVKVND